MYKVTDTSTAHGLATPHGLSTSHRWPSKTSTEADLLKLSIQLYPTGRVWNMGEGSSLSAFHEAFNLSFLRWANAAQGIITSSQPNSPDFTEDDAAFWEYIYGIMPAATLAQRAAVIYQRMAFPNNILPRQAFPYIQQQLQDAGFNVYLYNNIFYDGGGNHYYKTPADILGLIPGTTQHGGGTQHGGATQHGGGNYDVIANKLTREDYSTGGNLYATFFIAGPTLDTFAAVDKNREAEFRELVLKLKPAQLVAYIFVNYV